VRASRGLITESADMSCYINSKIIRKNLPIPCTEERPYQLRTRGRGENILDVYITQGESTNPRQCTILNLYRFSNITHVQGQNAILNVSYQYDANGVIKVSATERSTGRTLPMTVEPIPQDMSWLDAAPVSRNVPAHATIYLCIDQSGSMSGSPLAEAKRAAKRFVSESDLAHCSIGITSFADLNAVNINACQDASAINRAIDNLEHVHVSGGTSASPFGYTASLLRGVEEPRYIISLTDGCWSDQELTAREASACSGEGIEIVAIGFGGADQAFLKRIATRDEGGMLIDLNRLVETFSTIAQAITEQSGSGALVFKGN
jgi:molecular chaperone DnaK